MHYRIISVTMDALPPLHEVGNVFSCCELCTANKRCHLIILAITFLLMTFDMVTDWINWAEWYGVGGYDQYFFANMFEKIFLGVAMAGTVLWIIEVFIIAKKWIKLIHKHPESNTTKEEGGFDEFLPKPEIPETPLEPELLHCNDSSVQNDSKLMSKLEVEKSPPTKINEEEECSSQSSFTSDTRNLTKSLSEPEVVIHNEFPSESEVANHIEDSPKPNINKESAPKPKVINNNESQSEAETTDSNKSPCEPKVVSLKDSPPESEIMNGNESPSKVINYNQSKGSREESDIVNQLRLLVLILAGLFEDVPNVLIVYHTALIPRCGSTTKQNIGSGVTLATIISSMLNSLWTMICLFFELFKFTRWNCCMATTDNKKISHMKVKEADTHCKNTESRKKATGYTTNPPATCLKEACKITGKITACMLIFITFLVTFTLGFMTLSHVLGFIDLTFAYAGPLNLSTHVITGFYGPGLDAKPDEAMFVYLHYELPNAHYITLNNSKQTKSVPFQQVINRLYIGQFQELSHLKDETLTKAVPCSRAMPFEEHVFDWGNYPPISVVEFTNCKIIFTLRYFPINNNYQPFSNLIHDYHKFITIEYGIHINNKNICPSWIHPASTSSFLSQQVQEDIVNYTCNSACGQYAAICRKLSGKINQGISMSFESVEMWNLSLAVHGLKTPDTCDFHLTFEPSKKFCDDYWDDIELVKVPKEIEDAYPQFITIPITTTWDEGRNLRKFNNNCDKLWQNDTFLELDPGNY